MRNFLRFFAGMVATVGMFAGATSAAGAGYPAKPVKLIVPYAPGGSSDVIMRPVALALERQLGKKVVLVNVAGGDGAVGWSQAAQAPNDGYTLTVLTNAMIVREGLKMATVGAHDFVPIANVGYVDLTLAAKGEDGPYKDLKSFATAVKQNPNKLTVAMGIGTPAQIVAIQLDKAMGPGLRAINVGSGAEKKTAVLGGHVDTMIEPISSVIGSHRAGQLRILAVLSDKRLGFASDLPTAKEQGVNVTTRLFYGFGAPKGTPKEVIDAVASAVEKLGKDAAFQDEMKKLSFSWGYAGPKDFASIVETEYASTIKMVKDANL